MAENGPPHRSFTSVTIELPQEVVALFGATPVEAALGLRELVLAKLYRRGEVSGGYAAEVLGISKWDFIALLAKYEVPYLHLTEEELRREIEVMRAHRLGISRSSTPGP